MVGNQVLKTNVRFSDQDPAWQQAVAENLKKIVDRPSGATVLVQSFGKPKPAGPEWNGITDQLAKLGGNRLLINGLDGTTEYALVGRVGADGPPRRPVPPTTRAPTARLPGLRHASSGCSRGRSSAAFEPTATNIPTTVDEDGGTNLDLLEIAYQPLSSWPPLAPGAPADDATKAEQYICQQLGFCKAASSCPDLRSCYWQKPGSNWALKYSTLSTMPSPGEGQGFESTTFEAVKATLKPEVAAVANVNDYLDRLQEPLIRAEGRSYVDLQGVGQGIYDSLQRPAGTSIAPGLNIISAIAGIFGLLEGPVGQMGGGTRSVVHVRARLRRRLRPADPWRGRQGARFADGRGALRPRRPRPARDVGPRPAAGQRPRQADGRRRPCRQRLEPADKNDDAQTVQNLRTASKQWFYEALVPVAYPYLVRANSQRPESQLPHPDAPRAWPNQPDDAQMVATVGYGDGGAGNGIFFFTQGIGGGARRPPGSATRCSPRSLPRPHRAGDREARVLHPARLQRQIAHAVNGPPSARSAGCQTCPERQRIGARLPPRGG